MRILITGITGYIAQYLLRTTPLNFEITGTWHNPLTIQDKLDFEKINLLPLNLEKSLSPQFKNIKPDIVVHTAAESNIAMCEKKPEYAQRVNCQAVAELADWCVQNKTRLIYLSTDIVFDGLNAPYKEDDQPNPINIYGKSKYAGEQAVHRVCKDYAITRLALVLGKGLGRKKNFIDWLTDQVEGQNQIPLFTDEIRTPICAMHAAKLIWAIALSSQNGVFHCCSNKPIDRFTLGKKICDSIQKDYKFIKKTSIKNMTYARPADVSLIDTKLKKLFNIHIPDITEDINLLLGASI